jgi:hypothetical protein
MKIRYRSIAFFATGYAFRFLLELRTDNSNSERKKSSLVVEEISNSSDKFSVKDHFFEQLPRIIFLTLFWGIIALVIILMIGKGLIVKTTEVPPFVEHYLSEVLNLSVVFFEVIVFILITGLASIFGESRLTLIAQEEICRIFYNIGAFTGMIMIVLIYYYNHIGSKKVTLNNYILAFFLFAGYMILGLIFSGFFKWQSSRLGNQNRKK